MDSIIESIDYICQNLYVDKVNIYSNINNILPEIGNIYSKFLKIIPILNDNGMSIDSEIIISQLTRFNDAIENKDKVSIFDILKYEISDTIAFYKKIAE